MVRRRIVAITAVVLVVLGVCWLWWGRPVFLPFGDNFFVETVTLSSMTLRPMGPRTNAPVPIDEAPEQNRPIEDPIEVPVGGRYLRVDLKRYESVPDTFGGKDVSGFDRWVITFSVYRSGDPQGEGSREYICSVPDGTIQPDPAFTGFATGLPLVGHAVGGRGTHYLGKPALGLAEPGHNLFWTFIRPPPDQQELLGEYVYEVRLYPTAHWVSAIRPEIGDPIVLCRGTLLVVEDEAPPASGDGNAN